MRRLIISFFLSLLLSSTLLHAQTSTIDPPAPNLQAQAHRDAAVALEAKNDYDGAMQELQQALSIEREVKDRKGEGQTLISLGKDCVYLKRYEKAINFFQQDLPIEQEVKDRMREAKTLYDIGLCNSSLDQYEKAIDFYRKALPIEQEFKDRMEEAKTLNNLGQAYNHLSQYEKALETFQQLLPIEREVKNRAGEGDALYMLGEAYAHVKQYEKALETFQQLLPIEQEVKNRAGEADALFFLGVTHGNLSQYEKAIDYLQQAIPIEQEVKRKEVEAQAQSSLSDFTTLLNQTKSSGSSTSPASSNIVNHEETLNQAFRLTAEQLNQAIDKGKQLAQQGKKWDDVGKPVAQMPRGVKGEKGKSHELVVYCMTLNAVNLTAAAYEAANNYDPLPPRYSHDRFFDQVHFIVSLQSVPKVGKKAFDRNRLADEEDVQVTKFVLTDDKGNVINPLGTTSGNGVQKGVMDFSGTNRLEHTETSQTNENADASAYDLNGNSAYAEGSGTRTTTRTWTQYVPWSESHPYFTATYNVDFPLFDANGQPLIKTDAKSITLHIITPNGEKQVTYDLHPPKI